jgi:outer membrane protein assembly factor BamB
LLALLALHGSGPARGLEWPQWGGPDRNFKSASTGLAATWPANGPRQLWSRPLGEGHSAVCVHAGTLFTMYSRGEQEVVVALAADTGRTRWEYRYDAPTRGMDYEEGKGPHATPLVAGGRVFAVGATGKLHALDEGTGKVAWSHDLWGKMGGTKLDQGYSCSPCAYKDTVIVTVGGPGRAVVAFRQKDGSVAWKKHDFTPSPSSPLLIDVDGQRQLVVFLSGEVVGLDPDSGELLWRHPHATRWGLNISTPVWGEGNLLFCSSAYDGGSRVLRLTRKGGKTAVEELWSGRRMRVHLGNAVRVGEHIYGSSGDFGATFFTAVEVRTGAVAWQVRLPRASVLWADGRLLILDESGQLSLATVSPAGMKVHSRAAVLTARAWTVPTLVGKTLYLRDRKVLVALDLA